MRDFKKYIFILYAALLSLPVSIYYAIEHSIKLSNILPYFLFFKLYCLFYSFYFLCVGVFFI
ncbi:hypothetical protein A9F06_25825 [Klebsiella pneumoniae]|nr:hypothetical protein A9F06_25825 [Klebsiella pneumoniae]